MTKYNTLRDMYYLIFEENKRLCEAIEKAITHLAGIGDAGVERDGKFVSDNNWNCARQVMDDLKRAMENK
jgi:hypothetical protein